MAIIFGANGFAVSKSTGGVSVTRLVNGSSVDTPQYLPGDNFVVELDYHVTGTQYAVSIMENLSDGLTITNSSVPYTKSSTLNNYTWNISSPLTGVTDGKIFYQVHVSDSADEHQYIAGGSAWFSSYADVKDGTPTSSVETDPLPAPITISGEEGNGPCAWISDITELNGDPSVNGNGHLEAGENAQFQFSVSDPAGVSSYTILVNGIPVTPDSEIWSPDNKLVYGTAHAPMIANSDPNNLVNMFEIQAENTNSVTTDFQLPVYVPNYNYTAWVSGKWNGFPAQVAAVEPYKSINDGGWISLQGGNPIKVPTVNIFYNGPANINREGTGSLSSLPIESLFGISGVTGDLTATLNATPRGLTTPYQTYPIYKEGDHVSARFNGTSPMHNKNFNVILVNMSEVYGQFDLTNMGSILGGLKSLTPEDIKNGEMQSIVEKADIGSCDFIIDGSDMPDLNSLDEGVYALLVVDESLPNTPCLVSAAPIIVTKYDLQTTQVGPMAMPGSGVTLNENLAGGDSSQYVYAVMMVPEDNYSANLSIHSDGTVDGTWFTYNGLSLSGVCTMESDGTKTGTKLTIASKAGTHELNESVLNNQSELEDILMGEVNASNMSLAFRNTTLTNPDITVPTKSTMPTGNYTVLSIVLDRNTGNIAAVNQTTIQLGATFTYNLIPNWNLISVPLDVQNNTIDGFFTPSVSSQIVDLWEWNASTQSWEYWSSDPASPFWNYKKITTIDAGKGYWVNLNSGVSFTIYGSVPPSAPNAETPLHADWNLVGLTGLTPSTPDAMYPGAVDVWEWKDAQQTWKYWSADPQSPFWNYEHITTIQPGVGTWVNV